MLDLETTGGSPAQDRITEIAAVRIEGGREVARWSTLVNPGTRISSFIQNLTGISNQMVRDAPGFAVVAPRLLNLLEGAVLVAHNARFDYGFLQSEFARIETDLRVRTLCTVRLSRLLYPQHRSHGLDAIMQRHGLSSKARHRAMGDVDMVLAWLDIASRELGIEQLRRHTGALMQGSAALPPQLETSIADIPEAAGVYLFHGESPLPLYIGKSVNLRKRVMAHFQAAGREAREMRIAQEVRRVDWIETAGELGALLLEARLVKEKQPLHNRQLRRQSTLCAWRLNSDPLARPLLSLVRGGELDPAQFDRMYGVYRSKTQAISALRELADKHALCPQALGIESSQGHCFAHQFGRCKGLCCGQETAQLHHLRLQMALAEHALQAWPYPGKIGLREHNRQRGKTDIHLFHQWRHLATVHDDAQLAEALGNANPVMAFDLDTYRLLVKQLAAPRRSGVELLRFEA
ncbi:MAG: exonuclease domain-containing protein [Rhodoferax sp.]